LTGAHLMPRALHMLYHVMVYGSPDIADSTASQRHPLLMDTAGLMLHDVEKGDLDTAALANRAARALKCLTSSLVSITLHHGK